MSESTHIWSRQTDDRPPHSWPLVFIEDGDSYEFPDDEPIPDDPSLCDICRAMRLLSRQYRAQGQGDDVSDTESAHLFREHLPRLHDVEHCADCFAEAGDSPLVLGR